MIKSFLSDWLNIFYQSQETNKQRFWILFDQCPFGGGTDVFCFGFTYFWV